MNELSLFTGAGGGLLGTAFLLGWRCIGAVEWEDYPCKVLEARQNDGILEPFPIWQMDIREFNRRIAPNYKGVADVITAGFPCQPFSTAGKRLGDDDPRNMWPATMECIRIVRPRFALLENVPGLISAGYLNVILSDLAQSGYDARWRVLSAAELGAPHKRNRVWVVAYSDSYGRNIKSSVEKRPKRASCRPIVTPGNVRPYSSRSMVVTSYASCKHRSDKRRGYKSIGRSKRGGWPPEPPLGRVAHGVASRVDRLKALGNGQVPIVAATAWRLLTHNLTNDG